VFFLSSIGLLDSHARAIFSSTFSIGGVHESWRSKLSVTSCLGPVVELRDTVFINKEWVNATRLLCTQTGENSRTLSYERRGDVKH
jgi:hypothetical protein